MSTIIQSTPAEDDTSISAVVQAGLIAGLSDVACTTFFVTIAFEPE